MGFVVLFWQHLHNSIQDVVDGVTLSQPDGGKDPPKNDQQQSKSNYIQGTNINSIKDIQKHLVQVIKETAPLNPTDLLT